MSEYLALATLAASAIGAGANYAGARAANSANANMNAGSMAFAANQANQAEWFSREMAARQEAFQRAQSSSAQDFSERMMRETFGLNAYMAGTSYQRAMADMRASGLNPILAYKQGGASSPTVSAPSGVMAPGATGSRPSPTVSPHRMENELSGAVGSAMQAAQVVSQLENMRAQRDNIIEDTALKAQQTQASRANTALQTAQAITEGVRPSLIAAQTRTELGRPALVGAQAAQAGSSARLAAEQAATEPDRRQALAADAFRSREQGNLSRTDARQRQTFGPPGQVSSTLGAVGTTIQGMIQPFLNLLR